MSSDNSFIKPVTSYQTSGGPVSHGVRFIELMDLWVHLNDGGGSPGRWLGVEMRYVGHAGQRAQSVHLAHGHGNGGWRQAGRDQRMWHHHEGQLVQNWWKKRDTNLKFRLIDGERAEDCRSLLTWHRSDQQLHLKAIKTALHAAKMKRVSSPSSFILAWTAFVHQNLKGQRQHLQRRWDWPLISFLCAVNITGMTAPLLTHHSKICVLVLVKCRKGCARGGRRRTERETFETHPSCLLQHRDVKTAMAWICRCGALNLSPAKTQFGRSGIKTNWSVLDDDPTPFLQFKSNSYYPSQSVVHTPLLRQASTIF